jgi:hypothetical protein
MRCEVIIIKRVAEKEDLKMRFSLTSFKTGTCMPFVKSAMSVSVPSDQGVSLSDV